jgi:penicillin-binding protein 1A
VFANGGELIRPRFLRSILDRNGSSLPLGGEDRERVMAEPAAWILAGMLRDVNIRGTAADVWAGGFYHPSGGKTGTTNDYRDAWYIGFTKLYTVGIWIGTDDHSPLGPGHTGTDDAMPLWVDIMRGLHKGVKVKDFEKDFPRPAGVSDVSVCRLSGLVAQSFCDSVAHDFKVAGLGARMPGCRPELHRDEDRDSGMGETVRGGKGGTFLDGIWKKIKSPF